MALLRVKDGRKGPVGRGLEIPAFLSRLLSVVSLG